MPKALINEVAKSELAKGLPLKKALEIAYGRMNKLGFMKGPNETPEGADADEQFLKDHGVTAPIAIKKTVPPPALLPRKDRP